MSTAPATAPKRRRAKTSSAPIAAATAAGKADLISRYLAMRDMGKDAYQRADLIFEELLAVMGPGESVTLPDGCQATLVDRFAAKRKVWTPCGCSRFEIDVKRAKAEPKPDQQQRLF